MTKAGNILKQVAKSVPTGIRYYVIVDRETRYGDKTILAGPYTPSECEKKLKTIRDKEAYIATWDGKEWKKVL